MPIGSLLAGCEFDSKVVELLASAFETAWEKLEKSDNPLPAAETREKLARQIILLGQMGERDRARLVETALARLAPARLEKRSGSTPHGAESGRAAV